MLNARSTSCSLFFQFLHLSLIVFVVLITDVSWSQTPFFSFGKSVLSIGTANGIQPNYRITNGDNFFYGSLQQEVSIKGIPFQFTGRLSNEPYVSGRASYFRFSYLGRKFQRQEQDSLAAQMKSLETKKTLKLEEIYALEGKIGYMNYVLLEQPKLDTFTAPTFALPDSVLLKLPDAALPDLDKLSPLQRSLALANLALQLKQNEVKDLDFSLADLNQKYTALEAQKFGRFFSGISRFDVGFTALPSAHLSNNAIPMQGMRIRGKYQKWTYNAAVGLTVPNQLFSNQALDQVLNNSANLFNLSSFYQVNTSRLVSAAALEYGEVDKNSVYLENFYTGPSFKGIQPDSKTGTSNAFNIGGNYTPSFAKHLTINGILGYSVNFNDSLQTSPNDRLSTAAGLKYQFRKARGEFSAKYKNIGSAYNGFAQGVYISGVRHYESSYRQGIGNRFVAKVTGIHDEFSNLDSLVRVSRIDQGTLDLTMKIGSRSLVYASATLLTTDADQEGEFSYLLRAGTRLDKQFESCTWENQLESSYAYILGVDSTQELVQLSAKSGVNIKHWGYFVKGTYQRFVGLSRLFGTNYIIQPELSYRYTKSTLTFSAQYLLSEQFGEDYGLALNWSFSPSDFFTWKLTAQRWLVSEATFFTPEKLKNGDQFYLNFQMIVTLNNKRK